jgi:hypothetical protein
MSWQMSIDFGNNIHRTKDQRIQDAEYHSVGSDSQRQRGHGNEGKPIALQQPLRKLPAPDENAVLRQIRFASYEK